MAAASDSEVCWQDVFLSMSRVLSDVEMADTNPDLNYHEAALLLNRLETCMYILTSLNQELTLQDNQDSRTDSNDFLVLQEITTLMNQVHHYWCQKLIFVRRNTVSLSFINVSQTMHSAGPGRPSFIIPKEIIELLRSSGFYSWTEISRMFCVSRWTLYRRAREYNLQDLGRYSTITDEELDSLIQGYISRHGNTAGESYIIGYIRSLKLKVQRDRVSH